MGFVEAYKKNNKPHKILPYTDKVKLHAWDILGTWYYEVVEDGN